MSNMDRLNELAGNLGFRVDPHSGMMYGQRGAYPLAVEYNNNTYTISASVSRIASFINLSAFGSS